MFRMGPMFWTSFLSNTWPLLVVYVAGMIFALMRIARHRTPAVLVLIAMVLYVATMIGPAAYQQWVFAQQQSPTAGVFVSTRWVYLAANIVRAAATVCLFVAAFSGRTNVGQGYGFSVINAAPPPQPYPPGLQNPYGHRSS